MTGRYIKTEILQFKEHMDILFHVFHIFVPYFAVVLNDSSGSSFSTGVSGEPTAPCAQAPSTLEGRIPELYGHSLKTTINDPNGTRFKIRTILKL